MSEALPTSAMWGVLTAVRERAEAVFRWRAYHSRGGATAAANDATLRIASQRRTDTAGRERDGKKRIAAC
jgi:hypothetical protein